MDENPVTFRERTEELFTTFITTLNTKKDQSIFGSLLSIKYEVPSAEEQFSFGSHTATDSNSVTKLQRNGILVEDIINHQKSYVLVV